MEKDQNQDNTDKASEKDQKGLNQDQKTENLETNNKEQNQEQEKTPEEKILELEDKLARSFACLLYTSPSPRDERLSRMPSSA